MSRGIQTALLAVCFYAALLWAAVAWRGGSIESQLAEHAEFTLEEVAAEGVDLQVAFSGRDAVIEGTVPDREQVAGIAALVEKLDGVRVVENRVEFKASPEPASFAAERSADGNWSVDGRVANRSEASLIEGALRGTLPEGGALDGNLAVNPDTRPAPWATAVSNWLPEFSGMVGGGGGVAVLDGKLLLVGDVYSEAARARVLDAARAAFADSGLEVADELQLAEPPESPMFAIAPVEADGLHIAGRLRDPVLRDRIVELVRMEASGRPVGGEIAAGDHIASAAWLPSLMHVIPGLIGEVEELQVAVSEGVFLMAGKVAGEATRLALADLAQQAFEGISLQIENKLEVVAPPEPASLLVSRDADGTLHLSGLLSEFALGEPFVEAARAVCSPDGDLVNEIQEGDNVQAAPWVNEMAGLVPVFVETVKWGALSVHGNQVALEAEVFDGEAGDTLQALVANAFPEPEFKRIVEVRMAEPAGPSDEDIAALENTAMTTAIQFKGTSADLRPGEKAKLEPLAGGFLKVPGASLALIGNSSAKGGADIAKKRCAAVRSALEELGVDFLLLEIEISDTPASGAAARSVSFELR